MNRCPGRHKDAQIHGHTDTQAHTYTHTHIHTKQTYKQTNKQTHKHTHTRSNNHETLQGTQDGCNWESALIIRPD